MTIAVLTTGASMSMERRLGSKLISENLVTTEPATDLHGVGTHWVSLLAALAPKATIISIKVLFKSGSTKFNIVANGINRAVSLGANILILPLGAPSTARYSAVTNAVNAALDSGMIVVASAGNSGKRNIAYPANIDGVIAVGASDHQDNVSGYSQYGGKIIFAPGNSILAHYGESKKLKISGTNESVTVAGAIYAVLWSQRPSASVREIADIVERTGRTISVKGEQAVRIDAAAALEALMK